MTDVDRRSLLALLASGSSLSLAGCLGGRLDPASDPDCEAGDCESPTPTSSPTATPTYDCEDADRPEPELGADAPEDAVEPATYPDRPSSSSDAEVKAFVTEYERAYRRNELIEGTSGWLVGHGVSVRDAEPADAPDGGTYVRLRYTYWADIERQDGPIHADSPVIAVAYYVDDSVVLRTETEGHDAEAPDPLEGGTLLSCAE